jgi:uncharacterized protein YggT (Ycf19 family)
MGNMLIPIILIAIRIFMGIVIVNAVLSWFIGGIRNMTVRRIYWTTNMLVDPVLAPLRGILSPMTRNFGIDISPIILIIFLNFLEGLLQRVLE